LILQKYGVDQIQVENGMIQLKACFSIVTKYIS
jgi:hypothetical protein